MYAHFVAVDTNESKCIRTDIYSTYSNEWLLNDANKAVMPNIVGWQNHVYVHIFLFICWREIRIINKPNMCVSVCQDVTPFVLLHLQKS